MAEADWAALTDGLSTTSIPRGASIGFTPPNGGGSGLYVWNSTTSNNGAAGLYVNGVNFNPTSAGYLGRISGAVVRLPSGGTEGFSPMLFIGLQGDSVNDEGYLIGLQNEEASSIVLVKGAITAGLPSGEVGENGILRKSSDTYSASEWVHLRVDATVQGTGDVLIQIFQSDLDANTVSSPVWTSISGMDDFVDDVAGINSGSAPFTSGRFGFAFESSEISRRGAVDHIQIARQL